MLWVFPCPLCALARPPFILSLHCFSQLQTKAALTVEIWSLKQCLHLTAGRMSSTTMPYAPVRCQSQNQSPGSSPKESGSRIWRLTSLQVGLCGRKHPHMRCVVFPGKELCVLTKEHLPWLSLGTGHLAAVVFSRHLWLLALPF